LLRNRQLQVPLACLGKNGGNDGRTKGLKFVDDRIVLGFDGSGFSGLLYRIDNESAQQRRRLLPISERSTIKVEPDARMRRRWSDGGDVRTILTGSYEARAAILFCR
jgi:hypothetical protein